MERDIPLFATDPEMLFIPLVELFRIIRLEKDAADTGVYRQEKWVVSCIAIVFFLVPTCVTGQESPLPASHRVLLWWVLANSYNK